MYSPVTKWLQKHLESLFKRAEISVYDTHTTPLNEVILRKGFQHYFESNIWQTFDIRIDIAGFVIRKNKLDCVFIECKASQISLSHVSQLLGYCRVANPLFAYLLSTHGVGASLNSLIMTYNRSDILEYYWEKGHKPRRMLLAKWNELSKNVEFDTLLPPGAASNIGILE